MSTSHLPDHLSDWRRVDDLSPHRPLFTAPICRIHSQPHPLSMKMSYIGSEWLSDCFKRLKNLRYLRVECFAAPLPALQTLGIVPPLAISRIKRFEHERMTPLKKTQDYFPFSPHAQLPLRSFRLKFTKGHRIGDLCQGIDCPFIWKPSASSPSSKNRPSSTEAARNLVYPASTTQCVRLIQRSHSTKNLRTIPSSHGLDKGFHRSSRLPTTDIWIGSYSYSGEYPPSETMKTYITLVTRTLHKCGSLKRVEPDLIPQLLDVELNCGSESEVVEVQEAFAPLLEGGQLVVDIRESTTMERTLVGDHWIISVCCVLAWTRWQLRRWLGRLVQGLVVQNLRSMGGSSSEGNPPSKFWPRTWKYVVAKSLSPSIIGAPPLFAPASKVKLMTASENRRRSQRDLLAANCGLEPFQLHSSLCCLVGDRRRRRSSPRLLCDDLGDSCSPSSSPSSSSGCLFNRMAFSSIDVSCFRKTNEQGRPEVQGAMAMARKPASA
ncbi:hypothetical protein IMY05_C4498000400 [Salix suchowensis]|nr:hypothetical protein IMY05_C4498000400 [Salix suchowensis]